ncbi:hypothetical protein RJT34_25451 [Clitoria ternatea]|uniref:Tetratricopeptide repeat protein 5 OB fold domain-containing protein n=1 Tax=Clitoria ternatea TaxID=43366 RepID=A0AAN9III1_CLITE
MPKHHDPAFCKLDTEQSIVNHHDTCLDNLDDHDKMIHVNYDENMVVVKDVERGHGSIYRLRSLTHILRRANIIVGQMNQLGRTRGFPDLLKAQVKEFYWGLGKGSSQLSQDRRINWKHIKEGDQLTLLDPYFCDVDLLWKERHGFIKVILVKSIRLDFYEQVLVNGIQQAAYTSIYAQHKP